METLTYGFQLGMSLVFGVFGALFSLAFGLALAFVVILAVLFAHDAWVRFRLSRANKKLARVLAARNAQKEKGQ